MDLSRISYFFLIVKGEQFEYSRFSMSGFWSVYFANRLAQRKSQHKGEVLVKQTSRMNMVKWVLGPVLAVVSAILILTSGTLC